MLSGTGVAELPPYTEFGLLRSGVDVAGVRGEDAEDEVDTSEFVEEPVELGKTLSIVLNR